MMKRLRRLPLLGFCLLHANLCFLAFGQSTAFTYQGLLNAELTPATGQFDLRFAVHDSVGPGGITIGPVLEMTTAVSNGLFNVTLDFGAGVFNGPSRWLEIAVRPTGDDTYYVLSPRQLITSAPYAIAAGNLTGLLPANQLIGTLPSASLGGTYSGALTFNNAANLFAGSGAGLTSLNANTLSSGTVPDARLSANVPRMNQVWLLNGNAGTTAANFLGTTDNQPLQLRVNSQSAIHVQSDGGVGFGTTVLDANARVQFNLPSSVSVPHVRIKSALGNNAFGLQFANPDETWFVGPNIGNWSDDRFCLLANSSNQGLIIAANGNVAIDSVSAATPFAKLTVDGTIGFPTVATPAMYIYPFGTVNVEKRLIVHSPGFPEYGFYYRDDGDRFLMKSSAGDTTPSLVVDIDSNWVTIATDTPKPGYELSVNGQVVCEAILVQDSADWPDYVFEENYPLQPLDELETHIKERRHLPGIPTAARIKKEGIELGDMQKRMMAKIEELTLYVIDQNKRLAAQDKRIVELQRSLQSLLGEKAGAR